MQTTKKQNVIAVSAIAKQFVEDEAASHSAPNKGGDITTASNRELVDAMHRFVEANREQTRPVIDEEGNITGSESFDAFEVVVLEVLAERLDAVRVNTAAAKLKDAQAELAELRAKLAALTGE
jgi:hypothetical protein